MKRYEIARRAYEKNEIDVDTFGQLAMFDFSDNIIKKALERGWIELDLAGQLLIVNE